MSSSCILTSTRIHHEKRQEDKLGYLHVFLIRLEYIAEREKENSVVIFMDSHLDSNTLWKEIRR
jgi:hypothetical protein